MYIISSNDTNLLNNYYNNICLPCKRYSPHYYAFCLHSAGKPPSSSSPQSLPITIILAAALIFCFLLILLFFILGLTFGLYFSKVKQRQISHMVNGDLKTAGVAYEGGDAEQWTTEMQVLRKKQPGTEESLTDVVTDRTTLEIGEDLSFSDAQTQSSSSVNNLVEEHQL